MKNTRMNVYFKDKYIIDFVIFDRFLLRMVSSTNIQLIEARYISSQANGC